MSDNMKAIFTLVATVCALQAIKWVFGAGVSTTAALMALTFCVGVLWESGRTQPPTDRKEA